MNLSGITPDLLRQVKRIITHADCADGIASAMILHDALPAAAIEFIQYNTPEHRDLMATPGMLFCDMTPPRDRVQEFVDAGAIVLDHHKGAEDIVAAFGERGVFADEVAHRGVSGAALAYPLWVDLQTGNRLVRVTSEFLARERVIYNGVARGGVAAMAWLSGIRDTWQRSHPNWEDACAQAAVLVFYCAEEMLLNDPWLRQAEIELGRFIHKQRRQVAIDIAQQKLYRLGDWRMFNDGDKAAGHEMISDVAEAVRELDPEAVGVCGFHYAVQSDGSMELVFSLRSCGDMDVSAIARDNGGGGHTGAAGFSVPVSGFRLDPVSVFSLCLPVAS